MRKYLGLTLFAFGYLIIMGHFGYAFTMEQYFVVIGYSFACDVGRKIFE